jgi:hypothetical protein
MQVAVSRANRTLLPSVWAAAAVPASVLTAARKLKNSWTLRRLSLLIAQKPKTNAECALACWQQLRFLS